MRIMGIDPGTNVTGIGIVDSDSRGNCSPVFFGSLRFPKKDLWITLPDCHHKLLELITAYRPEVVALEDIFYGANVKSTVKLAHLRGVVIALMGMKGIPVAEYAPNAVKKTVAGYGQADKEQLRFLMQRELNVDLSGEPLDVSDALAVAVCHAQHAIFA